MLFKGVLGREIILRNEFVEINVTSFAERGLGTPSVKINYENITSIELKKSDLFKKGSIQFILAGSGFERGSEKIFLTDKLNPYLIHIPFGKFDEAKNFVNEVKLRIETYKNRVLNVQPVQNSSPDILDQLAKLSSLKDKGIITEDEFNTMKTQLLSRM